MNDKNQEKNGLGDYPAQTQGYNSAGYTEKPNQPPPYDSNTQGYGQPQGYAQPPHPQGYNQPLGYAQPPPPQGYSQSAGYQPVPQSYTQQGYPQTQQYRNQPVYGGQGHNVIVAQPVPVTSVMTTSQPRPTNWLVPAILTCLCCFWPTGICAILAARSANQAADEGNMQFAQEKANKARNLIIITVILGAVCLAVFIVLRVMAYSSSSSYYG
ncbi:PRRT1 [Mytilus coruscus]|uniref:PRRT1 n=1 Tax=Mytilus coruscus TaxID=42192 RepID=A0A6J8BS96_MYTCO|nr:PRRT1 [Mytilus coruscus]